jgi:hypothetical protein
MAHPYINWTKKYPINHSNGFFNIYVSSHKTGDFYGAVLYYIENVDRKIQAAIPVFEFKFEQFNDLTEDLVFTKCKNWIDTNLQGEYKIGEEEIKHF